MDEEVKKIAKQVLEARKNAPPGLDPNSPDAIIRGSGFINLGPEKMKDFMESVQKEVASAQQAALIAEALPFSLFILLASLLFGFIAWVAYRLIRSAKARELKQSDKKSSKKDKKKD